MSRHKKKHKATPTAAPIMRSNNAGIWLAVILAPALAFALWSNIREPAARAPRTSRTSHAHASIERSTEDLTRLMTRSFELKPEVSFRLHEVAAGIPEAEQLVSFFDSYAVASIVSPMGGLMVASAGSGEGLETVIQVEGGPHFMIVEATIEARAEAGLSAMQHWQYSGEWDVLYAPPGLVNGGLFVAAAYIHELRHAYDLNMGVEPSPPTADEWYDGEIRAYRTEIAVLDHHTGDRFSECIRQESERYPNDTFLTTTYLPRLPPCLNTLLGPSTGEAETTARGGLVYIMLDLLVAEHRGGRQEDLRAAIAHASPFR